MKNGKSLAELADIALSEGPKAVRSIGIDEAESLADILRQEHDLDVHPYDFTRVRGLWYEGKGLWQTQNPNGVPYARIATKQLLHKVAEEKGLDYTTIAGFKKLLENINAGTFMKKPINKWGTTLVTLLNQSGSYIQLVLDVVDAEPEFSAIKQAGLQPADFPYAPNRTWIDKDGKPTDTSRRYITKFIETVARRMNADPHEPEGFRRLIPLFNYDTISNTPVNVFGTTLASALNEVYNGSPSDAILDAIRNEPKFSAIVASGLLPLDFSMVPLKTWKGKDGQLTETAVYGAKLLIEALGRQHGVDPRTPEGFLRIAPYFSKTAFNNVPIDAWGRRLGSEALKAFGDGAKKDRTTPFPMSATGYASFRAVGKYEEYAALREVPPQKIFRARGDSRNLQQRAASL